MHRVSLGIAMISLMAGCSSQPASPPQSTAAPQAAPQETAAAPAAAPTTEDAMVKSAMSAAPEAIAKDATVITMDEKNQMKTLRAGTNGWTCMPDIPTTPGADPMCVDAGGMEWMHAYMDHKNPPSDKMAFGYMLMGGSDPSNDDPYAQAPPAGKSWITTGPHVMVLNVGNRFEGYPTTADDPSKPYVMFPNTPYAHLMLPVK